MPQLPGRREASILNGDDDRMSSVESGADLAGVGLAQPGARRAAPDEIAVDETRESQSGPARYSP
jgi:hypothetical protein